MVFYTYNIYINIEAKVMALFQNYTMKTIQKFIMNLHWTLYGILVCGFVDYCMQLGLEGWDDESKNVQNALLHLVFIIACFRVISAVITNDGTWQ